jgi:hypothetical protein
VPPRRTQLRLVAGLVPVAPPTASRPHPVGRLVRVQLRRFTEQAAGASSVQEYDIADVQAVFGKEAE